MPKRPAMGIGLSGLSAVCGGAAAPASAPTSRTFAITGNSLAYSPYPSVAGYDLSAQMLRRFAIGYGVGTVSVTPNGSPYNGSGWMTSQLLSTPGYPDYAEPSVSLDALVTDPTGRYVLWFREYTNDRVLGGFSVAQCIANGRTFCSGRRSAGWRVLNTVESITPWASYPSDYGGLLLDWEPADRETVNAEVVAGIGTRWEGAMDFAADPVFGSPTVFDDRLELFQLNSNPPPVPHIHRSVFGWCREAILLTRYAATFLALDAPPDSLCHPTTGKLLSAWNFAGTASAAAASDRLDSWGTEEALNLLSVPSGINHTADGTGVTIPTAHPGMSLSEGAEASSPSSLGYRSGGWGVYAWCRPNGSGGMSGQRNVIGCWSYGGTTVANGGSGDQFNTNYGLLWDADQGRFAFRTTSSGKPYLSYTEVVTAAKSPDVWYFVAGWRDGSGNGYITVGPEGGTRTTYGPTPLDLPTMVGPFRVGGGTTGSYAFVGDISSAGYLNAAPTTDDLDQLYQAGNRTGGIFRALP